VLFVDVSTRGQAGKGAGLPDGSAFQGLSVVLVKLHVEKYKNAYTASHYYYYQFLTVMATLSSIILIGIVTTSWLRDLRQCLSLRTWT
jgi:hypothetical protein